MNDQVQTKEAESAPRGDAGLESVEKSVGAFSSKQEDAFPAKEDDRKE